MVGSKMDKYLLCGEISVPRPRTASSEGEEESSPRGIVTYKGRKRGTVEFCGIWKHSKAMKDHVANGVCIMHGLDHRNVLRFFEWYETPKHIWVISELASGGSLAEILEQDGSISPDTVGGFIKDIASGLNYLHSSEICYCDLQPKKILLDTCECLKLSDFTLARSVKTPQQNEHSFMSDAQTWFQIMKNKSHSIPSQTQDSHSADYLPSPFYAAPELFAGSKFGVPTDMWSLGCVAFEMLTGRQPFCATSLESLRGVVSSGVLVGVAMEELGVWSELVCNLLDSTPGRRCSWAKVMSNLSVMVPGR